MKTQYGWNDPHLLCPVCHIMLCAARPETINEGGFKAMPFVCPNYHGLNTVHFKVWSIANASYVRIKFQYPNEDR